MLSGGVLIVGRGFEMVTAVKDFMREWWGLVLLVVVWILVMAGLVVFTIQTESANRAQFRACLEQNLDACEKCAASDGILDRRMACAKMLRMGWSK
jgi:hypothetical protein